MRTLPLSALCRRGGVALFVIAAILVADQVLKFYMKTHFALGEAVPMFGGEWAYLYFVENEGMAFGLDVVGGTVLLCCFRIVAVAFLSYFLYQIVRRDFPLPFVVCVSLVLAGAAGNIFDNLLYGMIFSESTPWQAASVVPFGEGYGTCFTGKVVDMLYFPIIRTEFPSWMPLCGGKPFVFFSPVFNIADSAITCGAFAIILFCRNSLQRAFALFDKKKESQGES